MTAEQKAKARTAALIPVMQAYLSGEVVQCRSTGLKWRDIVLPEVPIWAFDVEYRVKPRPPREYWVVLDKHNAVRRLAYIQPILTTEEMFYNYTAVKVREVRDDE